VPEQAEQRKLSRKERELQFRIDIVLDAAEEVFADASFATASVEEIAARAEISVGTLYNLFRSKEDIYCGLVSRAQNLFFEMAEQRIDAARGPRDSVLAAVEACLDHFNHYTRQFRLYVSATNGFQWELKSKLAEEARIHQQEFRKRLTDICQAGIDDGTFKKGIPAEVLATIIIAVPHAVLAAVMEDAAANVSSQIPHALAVVERILGTDVE
jgi:AcrR family transcriptional regulator